MNIVRSMKFLAILSFFAVAAGCAQAADTNPLADHVRRRSIGSRM